jgi:MATE family multidrug resistance protein
MTASSHDNAKQPLAVMADDADINVEAASSSITPSPGESPIRVIAEGDIDNYDDDDLPLDDLATAAGSLGQSAALASIRGFCRLPKGLTWGCAMRTLFFDAVPIFINQMIFFIQQSVTLAFVGQRLGVDLLAGFAIAMSLFNVCGMSITIGFLSGLDTLCSQAYGRDPSGKELCPILHRGIWVSMVFTLPIIVFFFASQPLLVFLFGTSVGEAAGTFLRHMPAYLLINTVCYALQRAMLAHQAAHLSLIATTASTVACPFANYYFVVDSVAGAAWALTVSAAVNTGVLAALAAWHRDSQLRRWPGSTWKQYVEVVLSVADIKVMCAVGFPAMVAVCAEWWSFEILMLSVAVYGPILADSFSVALNIVLVLVAAPNGVGTASSIRLGNALGANQPSVAAAWRRISILANGVIAAFDATMLIVFGGYAVTLFTPDAEVIHTLTQGLPIIALLHIFDCTQTSQQGIYRGAKEQRAAAKITLSCLWLVGLPLSAVLIFFAPMRFKFIAAVSGFCIGLCSVNVLLFVRGRGWNWRKKARAASHRQHDEQAAAEEAEAQRRAAATSQQLIVVVITNGDSEKHPHALSTQATIMTLAVEGASDVELQRDESSSSYGGSADEGAVLITASSNLQRR